MTRRLGALLVLVLVLALAFAASASAAFPGPMAVQGGPGLLSLDGSVHFVASKLGTDTQIRAVDNATGKTTMSRTVTGSWGVVQLTPNGLYGGLFQDGSAFVLQNVGVEPTSGFLVIDTKDLSTRDMISLKGTFEFDALSPDASRLYLIQHTSTEDIQHYVVRAYDLTARTLLPGRVADKTQKGWVMQGWAIDRATTTDGRWAYTLYANPGGFPFIHALDTVRGVAHCVGLPWKAVDQNPVYSFRLALNGNAIVVKWGDGRTWKRVDTKTWHIS